MHPGCLCRLPRRARRSVTDHPLAPEAAEAVSTRFLVKGERACPTRDTFHRQEPHAPAHAPKRVRNPRCLPRLPSAHVMRIALPPRHRSSLRQSGPARSRAPTSQGLGSRPRASDAAPGLSTRTMPMARFSEPDSGPTTSATLRRTGTRRGSWSLVRSRGDCLPAARLPARFPFGTRAATSRSRGALRRGRRARTGRIETRFRACYGVESPARPGPRTSVSRACPLEGRNPSSRDLRARCQPSRAEHLEVFGPAPAREGRCVLTKTEVRSTAARLARSRESLPPPVRVGLPSTRPAPPSTKKSVRAFATWSASAFSTAPNARL